MVGSSIRHATLLACTAVFAAPTEITYSFLHTERPNINFIPYTPEQRTQVAESMVNLFSVYVNRESKIQHYAAAFPNIDPIPRVKELAAKAADMTDKDFHYSFAELFLSLRDKHTNYIMPGPHRCYTAFQAADFTVIKHVSQDTGVISQKLVVRSFSPNSILTSMSGAELEKLSIGDEVIFIDGKTPTQYINEAAFTAGGANESGNLRTVLLAMSVRSGFTRHMPTDNSVTYMLRSQKTNKPYITTLPWIVRNEDSCIAEIDDFFASTTPQAPTHDTVAKAFTRGTLSSQTLIEYKKEFLTGVRAATIPVNPTSESILSWAIYKNKMGVIYLSSFTPESDFAMDIPLLIRGLLTNELAQTECVIFDVRDNGGGFAEIADLIPQLFAPKIVTSSSRALVGSVNSHIYKMFPPNDPWAIAYRTRMPGSKYSRLVKYNTDEAVNTLGMAYAKPVGVFTNGRRRHQLTLGCYSACEIFAANMQDNHAATIFGEDYTTGGGGAEVIHYSAYLQPADGGHFTPVPFLKELPKNHQDARVGWRQIVRAGLNKDKLIEDIGVISDKRTRPVVDDIIAGTDSNTQFDFIMEQLESERIKSGKKLESFDITPQLFLDHIVGEPIVFDLKLENIKLVTVLNEAGAVVKYVTVPSDQLSVSTRHQIQLASSDKSGTYKYTFKGSDLSDRPIFTTFRQVLTHPKPAVSTTAINIAPGTTTTLDLTTSGAHCRLTNLHVTLADGWTNTNGKLIAGYRLGVDTTAEYFLTTSVARTKVTVAIDAVCNIVAGTDYLTISYIDVTGTHEFGSWSGPSVITESYSFSPVGTFRISFHFTSGDMVSSARDVIVNSVVISA